MQVAGAKRGKTRASKSQLVWFYAWLVDKVARAFQRITNRSNRSNAKKKKKNNCDITFDTIENRSVIKYK